MQLEMIGSSSITGRKTACTRTERTLASYCRWLRSENSASIRSCWPIAWISRTPDMPSTRVPTVSDTRSRRVR